MPKVHRHSRAFVRALACSALFATLTHVGDVAASADQISSPTPPTTTQTEIPLHALGIPISADVPTQTITIRPSQARAARKTISVPVPAPEQNTGPRGTCLPTNLAHTDADFNSGSFVVQAGFSQNEIAAASFTIPAADFPIKIVSAEMVFATSNATVQTITEWSILFWDGNPNTGILVDEFFSDDTILPHIRLGPGTAGVNVSFSVDPGDPEQIFIFNNGATNTVSFGYKIVRHNNQTANPCFTAPPSSSNAFPTTDVSGLAQTTRNWLFALNCGSLGCPANGGWATFQNLTSVFGPCRPSGDWVMRLTYEPVNCTPPTGSCCRTDGSCTLVLQTQCSGGTFSANGFCEPNLCPQPGGACCFGTGCLVLSAGECAANAGTYLGNSVPCGTSNTCPTGACCLPNGSCVGPITTLACTQQGGTYRGNSTTCATQTCPQPTGACCTPSGGCLTLTLVQCNVIPGNWLGFGSVCSPSPCSPSTGACCAGVGCSVTTQTACTGSNRRFVGTGTTCNAPGNNTTPCCRADFTQNAAREPGDIFAFLNAYFSTDPAVSVVTDWDANAQRQPADIFGYLNGYFAGGCP